MGKKYRNTKLDSKIDKPESDRSDADFDRDSIEEQMLIRFKQDTEYRSSFSNWVMWIVPLWLIAVMVVFIMHGIRILRFESSEIIALLATTTANVLGLAFIVLKGFFGNDK